MIRIEASSTLTTVQDLGRHGHLASGVPRAGAADRAALVAGNISLGNQPGAAGIEIPFSSLKIVFQRTMIVALTGADCRAKLDSRPIPTWCVFSAFAGQTLLIEPGTGGVYTYLTFAGGIAVPEVLGSRSTQLRGGFGGYKGRGLQAGDIVPIGDALTRYPVFRHIPPPTREMSLPMRVIPAAEYEALDTPSRGVLWTADWKITRHSNRAGLRLDGPPLRLSGQCELRSHGILPGIIQLPSGGAPLIQMSDAATMGGYPKIGTVIDADLDRLSQVRPGSAIRFREVGFREAAKAGDRERIWRDSLYGFFSVEGNQIAPDAETMEILGIVTKLAGLSESGVLVRYNRASANLKIKIRKRPSA